MDSSWQDPILLLAKTITTTMMMACGVHQHLDVFELFATQGKLIRPMVEFCAAMQIASTVCAGKFESSKIYKSNCISTFAGYFIRGALTFLKESQYHSAKKLCGPVRVFEMKIGIKLCIMY